MAIQVLHFWKPDFAMNFSLPGELLFEDKYELRIRPRDPMMKR